MIRLFAQIDNLSRWIAILSAVLTVSIVAMILSEIVARSLFNISLSFAWEYSAYAMGVAMFCGAGFTLRTGGHIRVSILASSLPKRLAYWLDVICTLLGIGISGFLSYALIQFAWRSFLSGSTSPTMSATPLIIPQGAIAFGASLLTLQLVVRLVRLFIDEEPEDMSKNYQVD